MTLIKMTKMRMMKEKLMMMIKITVKLLMLKMKLYVRKLITSILIALKTT